MNGMSDSVYAHDSGVATDLFAAGDGNLFQRVMQMRAGDQGRDNQGEAGTVDSSNNEERMSLFKTVRPNIVQSIRAFRVQDLADEASELGQHFLYAHCANAQSKQEVLETIATSFLFPKHFGKNYDALYDCLTDLVQKAGTQPGFVIVLEHLPIAQKFDKEGRETLLDVFREATEFWAERKVAFRVFYSFA
jgi:RNAse (barnase) inhibitor barstar